MSLKVPGKFRNALPLILATGLLSVASPSRAALTLLAGWDFTNGTAIAVAPNAPTTFSAGEGTESSTAKLFLNGTDGASTWITATSGNQVTGVTGATSAFNGTGLSSVTTSPSALSLLSSTANGQSIVFALNMTGYTDLAINYASQRSSTGFTSQVWSYSTDDITFTTFDTVTSSTILTTGYTAIQAAGDLTAVNNKSSVFIKVTFAGASGTSGSNRLDNITFAGVAASAVPEPSTYGAIVGSIVLAGLVLRRRFSATTAV